MFPLRSTATSNSGRTGLKVLCAWCDSPSKESDTVNDHSAVSHGICRSCAMRYFGIDPVRALAEATIESHAA